MEEHNVISLQNAEAFTFSLAFTAVTIIAFVCVVHQLIQQLFKKEKCDCRYDYGKWEKVEDMRCHYCGMLYYDRHPERKRLKDV